MSHYKKGQYSPLVMISAGVLVAGTIFYLYNRNKKSHFTRTCLTADGNCQFVRSHVDYVYEDNTEIPSKVGRKFPHWIANPKDKTQPLGHGPVDLIADEAKLHNQDLLWKQYEHDWKGCGNGKPYIVNDEKTRFSLAEVGDIWAHRQLDSQPTPAHGSQNTANPALTEIDFVKQDPFDRIYGGSWLHNQLGD